MADPKFFGSKIQLGQIEIPSFLTSLVGLGTLVLTVFQIRKHKIDFLRNTLITPITAEIRDLNTKFDFRIQALSKDIKTIESRLDKIERYNEMIIEAILRKDQIIPIVKKES